MLKLSKKLDYSIVICTHLAMQKDDVFSAADIASRFNFSKPLVAKVLKELQNAGVVSSIRGPKGGYQLAMPSTRISLSHLLCVMEGQFSFAACSSASNTVCVSSSVCPAKSPIQQVHDKVFSVLRDTTIAELISGSSVTKKPETEEVPA